MACGQPQLIRRARGYAPLTISPILPPGFPVNFPISLQSGKTETFPAAGQTVLALGGQSKAGWCLMKDGYAHMGEYLGDLDDEAAWLAWNQSITHALALLGGRPGLIACDAHPRYRTWDFPLLTDFPPDRIVTVQHHHAHVASVMAEHDLVGPVLGVSFDGTGYGTDGAIWGGEFLICDAADFKRAAHLDYVSMLGGDASMKEGWKSAMCYGVAYGLAWPETDERYSLIKAGLEHQINTIRSTSMGRLFDAMASYLDIHHVNRYEGECAIMLENFAAEALKKGLSPYPMTFDIEEGGISARRIFEAADTGLKAGVSREALALGFHYAVADMILRVCSLIRDQEGINQIALTGGVFQNKIVMERSLKLLRSEAFSVYYNISVGPNDGGISLGQAYIGIQHLAQIRRKSCV
jgi:hydrogenase maturation protein HypF